MKLALAIIAISIWSLGLLGQTPARTAKPIDPDKILNDSAWGKTQTETDTSEMFFSPTRPGSALPAGAQTNPAAVREQQSRNNSRTERGALNQEVSINYRIRFFSARPVREALAMKFIESQTEINRATAQQWEEFITRDFGDFIVVIVNYDAADGRLTGPATQAFNVATLGSLKNDTYLERSDGQRAYLSDYRPPAGDGIGAKFVFARTFEGKPFLTAASGTVRFYAMLSKSITLNMRFKVSEMEYNGRLEY